MSDELQFSTISMPGGYAGLYRRGDEPFNVLLDEEGKPAIFATSILAVRAAKNHTTAKAPPPRQVAKDIDVLGVNDWRRQKADAYAEGQLIRKTGSFRPFSVEFKKGKRHGRKV